MINFIGAFNRVHPHVDVDSLCENQVERHEKIVDGLNLVAIKYDNGLWRYYAEQLEDDDEHKKGYRWSSRVGVVNKEFKLNLIEVVYQNKYCSCNTGAMEVSALLNILPEDYRVVRDVKWGGEIYFDFSEKVRKD